MDADDRESRKTLSLPALFTYLSSPQELIDDDADRMRGQFIDRSLTGRRIQLLIRLT